MLNFKSCLICKIDEECTGKYSVWYYSLVEMYWNSYYKCIDIHNCMCSTFNTLREIIGAVEHFQINLLVCIRLLTNDLCV